MCLPQREICWVNLPSQSAKKTTSKKRTSFQKAILFHTKTLENTLSQPPPTNFSFSLTDSPKKNPLSKNIHHQHDESTVNRVNPSTSNRKKRSLGGEFWGKSQGNYNTPLEHIPTNPPLGTMKGIPLLYSLLVKVARGVFQRCVETTFWGNFKHKSITSLNWYQTKHPPRYQFSWCRSLCSISSAIW